VAQCAIEKFTKKLLGESEVEAVLMRLDRLTEDEARMATAQMLGVVHGLVGNVRVVMEGTQNRHDWLLVFTQYLFELDGKTSTTSIRRDLGMDSQNMQTAAALLTRGHSRSSPNNK